MAAKFVKEGANVLITGRNAARLKVAKAEMEQFGGKILDFQIDALIG